MRVGGEDHKVVIPLSVGERVFSLKEHESIESLMNDIHIEDPTVGKISVHAITGEKISRRMPVTDFLSKDWILKIGDSVFYIKTPTRLWATNELKSLDNSTEESLNLTRDFFAEKAKANTEVSINEYTQMLEDHGISFNKDLIKRLHKLGIILHFNGNVELGDKVILQPQNVSKRIESVLTVPDLKQIAEEIKLLESELENLEEIASTIAIKATRSTKAIGWGAMTFLCAQWFMFARLTWWDSSWDVIEPITYFTVTLEFSIGGYIYYLFQKKEYANLDVYEILFRNRFKAIAKRQGFDTDRYTFVIQRLAHLKRELREERKIDSINYQ